MPRITIDLTDKAVAGLQGECDRTNAQQGTKLTVDEWIAVHLQEVAVAQQLAATISALTEQHRRDAQAALTAAIKATRDELVASLG